MRARGERGQAAPLMAAVVVLVGMLALLTVGVAAAAVERARARTAADAAALAGAAGDRSSAAVLAVENGGALESYVEAPGGDVEVVVRVGRARATARARAEGRPGAAAERGIVDALGALSERIGRPVDVVRVRPGGAGVELDPHDLAEIDRFGADVGLCRPSPAADPELVARCSPGG